MSNQCEVRFTARGVALSVAHRCRRSSGSSAIHNREGHYNGRQVEDRIGGSSQDIDHSGIADGHPTSRLLQFSYGYAFAAPGQVRKWEFLTRKETQDVFQRACNLFSSPVTEMRSTMERVVQSQFRR